MKLSTNVNPSKLCTSAPPLRAATATAVMAVALLAACASTADSEAARAERSDREAAAIEASARTDAAVRAVAAAASPDAEPRGQGDVELELWQSPLFRRRFTESYLSDTEVEPTVTLTEREVMMDVMGYLAEDRMDKAEALVRKKGGPDASAVFDFTLANIEFQQENLEEAAASYLVAVEKYPKFRRAWQNLGLIHVRLGMFDEALEAFRRVVELGGGNALTYGLLGYAYTSTGDNLAAESAYRMAVLMDPETLDWRMGLARCLFELRRYADAVALCDSMIERHPDRADLWLLQANAFIGLGQPLRAVENYELVDGLGASTPDSLNMLGDIYVNEELYDLAVQAFLRALEADPNSAVDRPLRAAKALTARGALAETGTLLDGIEDLRGDELEKDTRVELLGLRARVAVAQGASDEEVAILEQIVELDPLDGEALILLGQHAGRTGDIDRAILYFELAGGIEAFEADAKVRHAQLLVGERKYAEAIPLLRRAQAVSPRDHVQDYLDQVERASKNR